MISNIEWMRANMFNVFASYEQSQYVRCTVYGVRIHIVSLLHGSV